MLIRGLVESPTYRLDNEAALATIDHLAALNADVASIVSAVDREAPIVSEIPLEIYTSFDTVAGPTKKGIWLCSITLLLKNGDAQDDSADASGVRNDPNAIETALVIYGGENAFLLDGKSMPMHAAARAFGGLSSYADWRERRPDLEEQASVEAYQHAVATFLRMFCGALEGEHGPFTLVAEAGGANTIEGLDGQLVRHLKDETLEYINRRQRKLFSEMFGVQPSGDLPGGRSASSSAAAMKRLRRRLWESASSAEDPEALGISVEIVPTDQKADYEGEETEGDAPARSDKTERAQIALCRALVMYARTVFIGTLEVRADGMVSMLEDEDIVFEERAGLPVFGFHPSTVLPSRTLFVMRDTSTPKWSVAKALQFFRDNPGETLQNVWIDGKLTVAELRKAKLAGSASASPGSEDWDWDLPLRFQQVKFIEDIDIEDATFRRRVEFDDCQIVGSVLGRNSKFRSDLKFMGCEIMGVGARKRECLFVKESSQIESLRGEPVVLRLRGVHVDGDLDLSRTRAHGSVSLLNAVTTGSLHLKQIRVGPLLLASAEFGVDQSTIYTSPTKRPKSQDSEEADESDEEGKDLIDELRLFTRYWQDSDPNRTEQLGVLYLVNMKIEGDCDLEGGGEVIGKAPSPTVVLGNLVLSGSEIGGNTNLAGVVISRLDPSSVGKIEPVAQQEQRGPPRSLLKRLQREVEANLSADDPSDEAHHRKTLRKSLGARSWSAQVKLVAERELSPPDSVVEYRYVCEPYHAVSPGGLRARLIADGATFKGEFSCQKYRAEQHAFVALAVLGSVQLHGSRIRAGCNFSGVIIAEQLMVASVEFGQSFSVGSRPTFATLSVSRQLQVYPFVLGQSLAEWRELQQFAKNQIDICDGRELMEQRLKQRVEGSEDDHPLSISWIGGGLRLDGARCREQLNLVGLQCGGAVRLTGASSSELVLRAAYGVRQGAEVSELIVLPARIKAMHASSLRLSADLQMAGVQVFGSEVGDGVNLESSQVGGSISTLGFDVLQIEELRSRVEFGDVHREYVRANVGAEQYDRWVSGFDECRTIVIGDLNAANSKLDGELNLSHSTVLGRLVLSDMRVRNDVSLKSFIQLDPTIPSDATERRMDEESPPEPEDGSKADPAGKRTLSRQLIRTQVCEADLEFMGVEGDLKLAGLSVGPVEIGVPEPRSLDKCEMGLVNARGVKVQGIIELCYPHALKASGEFDKAPDTAEVHGAQFRSGNFEAAKVSTFVLPTLVNTDQTEETKGKSTDAWVNLFGASVQRLMIAQNDPMDDGRKARPALIDLQDCQVGSWPGEEEVRGNGDKYGIGLVKFFRRVRPFDSAVYASADMQLRAEGRSDDASIVFRRMAAILAGYRIYNAADRLIRTRTISELLRLLAATIGWSLIAFLFVFPLARFGAIDSHDVDTVLTYAPLAGAIFGFLVHSGVMTVLWHFLIGAGGLIIGFGTYLPWLFLCWLGLATGFYVLIGQHAANADLGYSFARASYSATVEETGAQATDQPPAPSLTPVDRTDGNWSRSMEPMWLSFAYAVPLFSLAVDEGRIDDFKAAPVRTCTLVRASYPWEVSADDAPVASDWSCGDVRPAGYAVVAGSPRSWARTLRILGWAFIGLSIVGFQRMMSRGSRN